MRAKRNVTIQLKNQTAIKLMSLLTLFLTFFLFLFYCCFPFRITFVCGLVMLGMLREHSVLLLAFNFRVHIIITHTIFLAFYVYSLFTHTHTHKHLKKKGNHVLNENCTGACTPSTSPAMLTQTIKTMKRSMLTFGLNNWVHYAVGKNVYERIMSGWVLAGSRSGQCTRSIYVAIGIFGFVTWDRPLFSGREHDLYLILMYWV